MAHVTAGVEYALHCLLWLIDKADTPLSSRDLADLQGLSPTFVAKIFAKLEKAGIVRATEGVRGGYALAKAPGDISVLAVMDAVEGRKPLFDCQEIRGRCAVFGNHAPGWALAGTCSIHAVMLRAEKAMRESLAAQSLADIATAVYRKAPSEFAGELQEWIDRRVGGRGRRSGVASAAS